MDDRIGGGRGLRDMEKTWGTPWSTLWPTLWGTLWPTGDQFFKRLTWLIIAINLCKKVLQQSVISRTLFRPLGGVALKFSKQTSPMNLTFVQLSYERAIMTHELLRAQARSLCVDWVSVSVSFRTLAYLRWLKNLRTRGMQPNSSM